MTTIKTRYIPLFIVLALTLTAALGHSEDFTVGLGVSDYEARPIVTVGSSLRFEVARVSNQGTLSLTITPTYVPDYNATEASITVIFTPNTTTLAPQENILIYGEVTEALAVGTFNGKVEFKTSVVLPANATGNPSTPGGSAKVTITITEVPPAVEQLPIAVFNVEFNPLLLGIPIGFSGLGAVVYLHHRRSKSKHEEET
jgi:hypothetical protein